MCEDCDKLVAKYGKHNLNYCDDCEHYYLGKYCGCVQGQEDKIADEEAKRQKEQVQFN